MVRCLAEVRYFIIEYIYSIILYTNYQALKIILKISINIYRRITRWIDRLIKYNYIIKYRLYKSNIIRLVDKIS